LARVDTKLLNIAFVFRVVRRWLVCEQAGSSAITFLGVSQVAEAACSASLSLVDRRGSVQTLSLPTFAGFSIPKRISFQPALSLRCVDPVPRATKPPCVPSSNSWHARRNRLDLLTLIRQRRPWTRSDGSTSLPLHLAGRTSLTINQQSHVCVLRPKRRQRRYERLH
jgi:hypothetical protein